MKKAKKAISILMCAVLLFCLLPTAALAVTGTVSFQIRSANGASGTVSYRFGSEGNFTDVVLDSNGAASVNVPENAATITIKAVPAGDYQINQGSSGIWIGGNKSESATFSFNDLKGETGWTYTLTKDVPQFVVEFDNNDGTGGGNDDPQNPPAVSQGDIKFEIGGDSEGGSLAYSIGDDTVWHNASNDMVISKNDLPASSTIYVKATPNSGYQLDDYVDNGVSVNQVRTNGTAAPLDFTENVASFSYSAENTYEITVRFMTIHGPGGGNDPGQGGDPGEGGNPGGGTTPEPTNYEGAKDYIEGWDLAYYGADADAVKTSMATELWNEGFCVFNGHTGDYTGMFKDDSGDNSFSKFQDAISLSAYTTDADSEILDLPYYTYTVMLHDDEDNTKDVTATGKVYVLENAKKFGVKIGNSEYHLLDTTGLSGENVDLYVQSNSTDISNIKVFGNGVCAVGRLDFGSGDGWAAHITQEHSGLTDGPGCRLVVLPADYTGVKIVSDVTAAAWGFAEVPIFATGSNSPVAEIFYGNDGTEGRKVTISQIKDSKNTAIGPAIAGITVDGAQVNPNVATITNNQDGTFTVAFNSGYDVIPLNVTYTDGNGTSIEKLTIHRVGLHLADDNVSNGSFQVWHGTDSHPSYSSDAQKVVTAAFYYIGEATPTESISLFVTVNTTTGTTRKVVTRLNSDFIATTGNDKWADDFLLWSGTDEEYANLISISAIAYSEGEDGSFGGVKAGSGTGVTWTNEAH